MEILGVLCVVLLGACSLVYVRYYKPLEEKDVTSIFEPIEPVNPVVEPPIKVKTNRERLYDTSKSLLGIDLVNDPRVPNEVQCASTVNAIFKKCFGKDIGGGASTALMFEHLKSDPRFKEVVSSKPGTIIISPTGTSKYHTPHGHVGICGKTHIMSNNSNTGELDTYFTEATWRSYYQGKKGFPVYFFDVL